jgi:hypothetical protein
MNRAARAKSFFEKSDGISVCPDGSAVDHLECLVVRGVDGVHQRILCARFSPSYEAVVTGSARAIPFRQVSPGRTE